jgi:hypothetical protein
MLFIVALYVFAIEKPSIPLPWLGYYFQTDPPNSYYLQGGSQKSIHYRIP